jgi:hypothetical protein
LPTTVGTMSLRRLEWRLALVVALLFGVRDVLAER